jgi:hypothetical protein
VFEDDEVARGGWCRPERGIVDVIDIEREYAVKLHGFAGLAWGGFTQELRPLTKKPAFVPHRVLQVPIWPIGLLAAVPALGVLGRIVRDSRVRERASRGRCVA